MSRNGNHRGFFGGNCRGSGRVGFSLMELMISVAIIAILVSILIPTISKVRQSANTASTRSLLANLEAGIREYKSTFGAFPGPLADYDRSATPTAPYTGGPWSLFKTKVIGGSSGTLPPGFAAWPTTTPPLPATMTEFYGATGATNSGNMAGGTFMSVTGTNNLVLGLLGGLYTNAAEVWYNPALVGKGPIQLRADSPRQNGSYFDGSTDLSWHDVGPNQKTGFVDVDGVGANDCPIPSIMDKYTTRMPILYLRAAPGINGTKTTGTDPRATVVDFNGASSDGIRRPYNLAHIIGYTTSGIGSPGKISGNTRQVSPTGTHGLRFFVTDGKTTYDKVAASGLTYYYPYEANLYLSDPSNAYAPRKKDEFILISAGPDRVYGTDDDITSFGDVRP